MNNRTLCSVIAACEAANRWRDALAVFDDATQRLPAGRRPALIVFNAALDAICCGGSNSDGPGGDGGGRGGGGDGGGGGSANTNKQQGGVGGVGSGGGGSGVHYPQTHCCRTFWTLCTGSRD